MKELKFFGALVALTIGGSGVLFVMLLQLTEIHGEFKATLWAVGMFAAAVGGAYSVGNMVGQAIGYDKAIRIAEPYINKLTIRR